MGVVLFNECNHTIYFEMGYLRTVPDEDEPSIWERVCLDVKSIDISGQQPPLALCQTPGRSRRREQKACSLHLHLQKISSNKMDKIKVDIKVNVSFKGSGSWACRFYQYVRAARTAYALHQ